jgi:hypothetical protein
MTTETARGCAWCGTRFRARATGGREQCFCRPACRRDFHSAARSWALAELQAGRVTVGQLRGGPTPTRTLAAGREGATPEQRNQDDIITVSFDVLPVGVENLRRDGWVTGHAEPNVITDAVLAVMQRALTLRLRR